MNKAIQDKILLYDDLLRKLEVLKNENKTIVHTHGIFDLIHPGITEQLHSAKAQGDILVVTISKSNGFHQGTSGPLFHEQYRAENVASLEYVDYVSIVDEDKTFDTSITLQDKFIAVYNPELNNFLASFSKKYTYDSIIERINSIKDINILLIGDGIIDEYYYCESMYKSSKAPIVVHKYLSHEIFTGGVFAVANHCAEICDNIQLLTLLGQEDSREEFIMEHLNPKIKSKFFFRKDGPTIIKKRYINQCVNQKLFEINYLNNSYINTSCETEIINYLTTEASGYDIVIVCDFGHGLITNNIIKVIEKESKKFAVNTQNNAANAGYNMITKYHNPNFVCLDEHEIRWAAQERFAPIEEVAAQISKKIECEYLIVTLGKRGSFGIAKNGESNSTPVFSSNVVDTVGSGDAFFAYTAPYSAYNMPLDFISFLGNAVGALAVQIMGNRQSVKKQDLFEFIHSMVD